MIDKWQSKSIWVYRKPIDFRKQLNGLVQTIIDETNGKRSIKAIVEKL